VKRFLILGGTAWLGGHVASTALERGHEVTCLARGSAVPPGAALIRADRTGPDAYDQMARRQWDVVVDVSRQPGQVDGAVRALADCASFFVFVSSGNVYADQSVPRQAEDSPLLPPLDSDVMHSMDTYGEAKVACEQHVQRHFGPDRALIARVGLIGGPGDIFDRSGYWPLRFARPATEDGTVLVPDAPTLCTQVIDVRDLAAWLVDAGSRATAGIFNATGTTVPLDEHLHVARSVSGHTGPVVRADPKWLVDQGVEEWMGERSLPLWLVDPDWFGFNARDNTKALRAGLILRPLERTLADTLAWERGRDRHGPRRAGLSDDDERALIAALSAGNRGAGPPDTRPDLTTPTGRGHR
jgi:2'-hydroxyisoflavone reductase